MKKRYNIMLNPAVVAKIDFHAEELDMSRSDLINRILFDELMNFGDVPDMSDPELEGQTVLPEVIS
jgi:hypothetical protein